MGQACSEPNLNKGLKRSSSSRVLPDVSHEQKADVEGVLDQVGMSNIEVPLKLAVKDYGTFMVPAKINAYVNLPNAQSKGIHMSRLYIKLQESFEKNIFDIKHLKDILKQFVQEQDGLSDKSFVRINFKLPVKRKALISEAKGWRFYPVWIKAVYNEKQNQFQFIWGGEVLYSSTCPCSAALSRQIIQDNFKHSFSGKTPTVEEMHDWLGKESSINATPHAQRSVARFKVLFNESKSSQLQWLNLINLIEGVLKTPVQTAVKREDEQEFARLNASNLMFCEDAARRIKQGLDQNADVENYLVKVDHRESLHPHDATATVSK